MLNRRKRGALRRSSGIRRFNDVQKVTVKDLGPSEPKKVKGSKPTPKLKAGKLKINPGKLLRSGAKRALGYLGAGLAIKDEIDFIKEANKYTFGRPSKPVVKKGEKYGPAPSKDKGTIGGLIKKDKPKPTEEKPTEEKPTTTPEPSSNTDKAPKPPKKKERFKGTVDEGRRIWAEKYSGDKYKGQAIHKEAKAYLLKIRKKDRPNMSGRPLSNKNTA